MVNLMIADDNVSFVESLSYMLTKEEDFRIMDICHNGLETIMDYNSKTPDVLLLDLNMPGLNKLDVLNNLNSLEKNVIIMSASNEYRLKLLNMKKVYWVLEKPFDYKVLFDLIREIRTTQHEENLNKKIDELLKKLLFDPLSKGTILFKTAILMAYKDPKLKLDDIYEEISIKIPKNVRTIHSTIGKCVATTVEKHDNINLFCELFPDFYGDKPTTKQLIRYCLNYLNDI